MIVHPSQRWSRGLSKTHSGGDWTTSFLISFQDPSFSDTLFNQLFINPPADTPPGTSDEHLTVVRTLMNTRPEGAVIVTTPQELALATIRKEINFCHKMRLPILGVVKNMDGFVCPCCEVRMRWSYWQRRREYICHITTAGEIRHFQCWRHTPVNIRLRSTTAGFHSPWSCGVHWCVVHV